MSNFTFLTEDQIFGPNKIDVIEKRGAEAVITDFSILLGGYVENNRRNNKSLDTRTGWYWTKSDDGNNGVRAVDEKGNSIFNLARERNGGIRLVLPFSSIESILENCEYSKRAEDGILEVEYGYCPQKAASKEMQGILGQLYEKEAIEKIENTYTTDSEKYDAFSSNFNPKIQQVYEYNGKKYVRIEANSCYDGDEFTLSNGEKYQDGDIVWVEVEPVNWLFDEKAKMLVTEKLIFSGVQFDKEETYHTQDFDKTEIKMFIDNFFVKDLEQFRITEKSEEIIQLVELIRANQSKIGVQPKEVIEPELIIYESEGIKPPSKELVKVAEIIDVEKITPAEKAEKAKKINQNKVITKPKAITESEKLTQPKEKQEQEKIAKNKENIKQQKTTKTKETTQKTKVVEPEKAKKSEKIEESEEIIELKDLIKPEKKAESKEKIQSKETAESSKIVEPKVTEQSPKVAKPKVSTATTKTVQSKMEEPSQKKVQQPKPKANTATRSERQYNLEFGEVTESDIIRGAIEGNVSIFLHGKPGSGKSERVRQLDPDFIELNLSHLDPELLDGLAGEKDGEAVHIKPPWLEELESKCEGEPDKLHILFLEELTNASQMMQSKAYGIALDKKVAGTWKLPENARVIAAGNELGDSLVASEMAEPLYDRFAHVNIETTTKGWLEWAETSETSYERLDYKKQDETRQKIHPAIYSFISYKGEKALRTPFNRENPQPHADPRRWKMASDMLYASNNPNTLKAIVGEELTKDFVSFCKTPTITVQDVISGNYTEQDLKMDLGRKLSTVLGLVNVDDKDMPKVREFAKKLGPEMCRKFELQWASGDEERLEQIQELRLIDQERAERNLTNEHTSSEAQGTSNAGMSAYSKINGSYENYLAKEKNKKSKTNGR